MPAVLQCEAIALGNIASAEASVVAVHHRDRVALGIDHLEADGARPRRWAPPLHVDRGTRGVEELRTRVGWVVGCWSDMTYQRW